MELAGGGEHAKPRPLPATFQMSASISEAVPPSAGAGEPWQESLLGLLAEQNWAEAALVTSIMTTRLDDCPRQTPLLFDATLLTASGESLVVKKGTTEEVASVMVLESPLNGWCWVEVTDGAELVASTSAEEFCKGPRCGYMPASHLDLPISGADGPTDDAVGMPSNFSDLLGDLLQMGFKRSAIVEATKVICSAKGLTQGKAGTRLSMDPVLNILLTQPMGERAQEGFVDASEVRDEAEEPTAPEYPELPAPSARARQIALGCSLTAADSTGRSAVELASDGDAPQVRGQM
jgi:hypothetical protein